ncbi:MAG TPA: DUF1801 domain-containing protein [Anaerolineaceae bacterium]|jgi:hypothetical protein|nr:DUF1801 domain-containing protein [Chloroflexota bacterium]HOA21994.1 DUF1801 domain-containing protein [Anaerolineaceae bacterium]HOG77287.1 DUF1801 domain-containing protein [Anaerolineaceae bacterium]
MVSSAAQNPEDYLAELPDDRRREISIVRELILAHLPQGYVETMRWGMLSYEIPLAVYPDTYNGQPLNYIGLAAQKQKNSLYLMGVYADPAALRELMAAYERSGLKPDMGKSCLRFRAARDLPLEKIGELIASLPPDKFIALFESSRQASR